MSEPDVIAIRRTVQERVQKQGLRRIARQVGMSPSGLQKFIGGAAPYQKTQLKIIRWSARYDAGDTRSPREVLIDELLDTLPETSRDDARAKILRIIARSGSR